MYLTTHHNKRYYVYCSGKLNSEVILGKVVVSKLYHFQPWIWK